MADCYFRIKCLVAAELQVSALHVICAVRLDKACFMKILAKGRSVDLKLKEKTLSNPKVSQTSIRCDLLQVKEPYIEGLVHKITTPDRLI